LQVVVIVSTVYRDAQHIIDHFYRHCKLS